MATDGLSGLRGGERHGGQVVSRFLALAPVLVAGMEHLGVALHFYQGAEVIMPGFCAGAGEQEPDARGAPLDPAMTAEFMAMMAIHRPLHGVGRGEALIQ